MCILIKLYSKLFGKLVGKDSFGNSYYEQSSTTRFFRDKTRWVCYKGKPDPTTVSGTWFNWLHFQTDQKPAKNQEVYPWQKEHAPNLTGTDAAYFPNPTVNTPDKRWRPTSLTK